METEREKQLRSHCAHKDRLIKDLKRRLGILPPEKTTLPFPKFKFGEKTEARLRREVGGALRNCIDTHGDITKEWISSASKRVVCVLRNIIAERHPENVRKPILEERMGR